MANVDTQHSCQEHGSTVESFPDAAAATNTHGEQGVISHTHAHTLPDMKESMQHRLEQYDYLKEKPNVVGGNADGTTFDANDGKSEAVGGERTKNDQRGILEQATSMCRDTAIKSWTTFEQEKGKDEVDVDVSLTYKISVGDNYSEKEVNEEMRRMLQVPSLLHVILAECLGEKQVRQEAIGKTKQHSAHTLALAPRAQYVRSISLAMPSAKELEFLEKRRKNEMIQRNRVKNYHS